MCDLCNRDQIETFYCPCCHSEVPVAFQADFSCSCGNDNICTNCTVDTCCGTRCRHCTVFCRSCNEAMTEDCAYYDDYNECFYCQGCVPPSRDIDLDDVLSNPRLHEYNARCNDWKFIKQPWENTIYLGVEVEVEYIDADQDQLFEITNKYMPRLHAWMHDGSLNNGGEFVITPHTLQSLKKLNFRSMFAELRSEGARSWTPNTCGIHVHVGLQGLPLNTFDKVKEFFLANRDFIQNFSGRKDEQFNRWCSIPDSKYSDRWGDHYCALCLSNKGTLEFRIFRGTLNYKRFSMNLVFVQALIEFTQQYGRLACGGKNSLKYFKEYVERNYAHLYKFFKEQGL